MILCTILAPEKTREYCTIRWTHTHSLSLSRSSRVFRYTKIRNTHTRTYRKNIVARDSANALNLPSTISSREAPYRGHLINYFGREAYFAFELIIISDLHRRRERSRKLSITRRPSSAVNLSFFYPLCSFLGWIFRTKNAAPRSFARPCSRTKNERESSSRLLVSWRHAWDEQELVAGFDTRPKQMTRITHERGRRGFKGAELSMIK